MSEYYMSHTGTELDEAISKVKNGYIDKTKIKHFATGVVNNVTAGQQLRVTGIKDAATGEAFDVKGVICFISPTTATNFQTAANKPGLAMFYKDSDVNIGATLTCVNTIYSVRAHPTAINSYLTINGNSFTLSENTASMYGILAAPRWRWYAWG